MAEDAQYQLLPHASDTAYPVVVIIIQEAPDFYALRYLNILMAVMNISHLMMSMKAVAMCLQ